MDRREAIKRTTLLFGVVASSSVISGILNGCTAKKEINWQPSFFSIDEAKVVSALVDEILPKTSTPGGIDIGVDAFIDKMIGECYTTNEQIKIKEGLATLSEYEFVDKDSDERIQLLKQFENEPEAFDPQTEANPHSFFNQIKSLCLLGYFTSEEIMTNHLEYVPIPTKLEGCTPIKENQKLIVGNHV